MRIAPKDSPSNTDAWIPPLDTSTLSALVRSIGQVGAAILALSTLHTFFHGSYLISCVHFLGAAAFGWIAFSFNPHVPATRRAAALTWILLIALTLTVSLSREGIRDVAMTAFPVSILIASLVLNRWQYMALAITSILTIIALYFAEIYGVRQTLFREYTTRRDLMDMIVIMTGTSIAIRLITENLQKGLWRMHRLAYFDSLTGLPNRRALQARLTLNNQHSPELELNADFFFAINLDRFRRINSSFGHAFGDRVLEEIGARLSAYIEPGCMASRHGGGGLVVAANAKFAPDPLALARRIQETIRKPIIIDTAEIRIDACIGISPVGHLNIEDAIGQAFIAVVAAKRRGSGSIVTYADTLGVHVRHEFWIESAVRNAVENGVVDIVYQPIMEPDGQRVLACEALLRLKDSEGRAVPTLDAVQLAEATGLIYRLGWLVLESICRDVLAWRDMRLPHFPISLNLSALQLSDASFVTQFSEFIQRKHLTPQDFILEITETAAATDSKQMHQSLAAFRKLGFRIAVDDFGAGQSSLGRLKLVEADIIKFDGNLIQQIDTSEQAFQFFRHAVEMVLSLNCVIFVEGIETQSQAVRIRETSCIGIQGFLYSLPLSSSQIIEFITTRSTGPLNFARRVVD